jgi:mercuric ion transport protein
MLINVKNSLVAGILAALGASACCVGPLLLLTLGIGGAWVGRLTVLEPYRPYFTALPYYLSRWHFTNSTWYGECANPGTAVLTIT